MRAIAIAAASLWLAACQAETFTSPGPAGIEVVHGPPALVSLGTELDTLLQVRIVDAEGHPRGNVPVTWRITVGDGEILPTSDRSAPDGLASARWKFGMIPGPKQVQVVAAELDPVTLSTEARGFRAVQVTAGYTHACALDDAGAAWCWNADSVVRGAPGAYNNIRPTPVQGGHQFVSISAGDSFTCGLTASGEVWCWGHAYGGAFGPSLLADQAVPVRIPGLPSLRVLRAGEVHACGIATADSTTWCWGNNGQGQSGAGAGIVGATAITTSLRFTDLAVGSVMSCGLTGGGTAYCWGSSAALGDSGSSRTAPTTPVAGGHIFVEIQAGDNNACGRTARGEVWCWGSNTGIDVDHPTPAPIDLPPATSLAVAFDYLGVTMLGGRVKFVTFGDYGLPDALQDLGVAQLAGRGSFCLIARAGDVYCSGSIVDQVSCSSVSPFGCAPIGPIPLPAGGRVYGYPPFGD